MSFWLRIALTFSWAVASAATAQDVVSVPDLAASGPQVAVVVESHQAGSAERVRAALAQQSGVQISSLDALLGPSEGTPVLLSVARSTRAGVIVTYWDVTGRFDTLATPVSQAEGVFELVASALGAALLRRNLPQLARDLSNRSLCVNRDCNCMGGEGVARAWTVAPVHRRTYPITFEDF